MATGQETKTRFLAERMPEELAENFRQSDVFVIRMFLWIMLVTCWFPLLATSLAGKIDIATAIELVTLNIIITTLLVIIVVAIETFNRNRWTGSKVPVVEYCDDTLTLRTRRGKLIAKLDECHFWIGPAHYMTFGLPKYAVATPFLKNRFAPVADRDVILIEILPLFKDFGFCGRVRGYTTVAVGFTVTGTVLVRWARPAHRFPPTMFVP